MTELVKVARAENESEAEFLQGLLREEGVSSSLRRSPGFDVPDYLAAGPRDVLVDAAEVHVARQLLLQTDAEPVGPDAARATSPLRVLAVVVPILAVVALIVWLGIELPG